MSDLFFILLSLMGYAAIAVVVLIVIAFIVEATQHRRRRIAEEAEQERARTLRLLELDAQHPRSPWDPETTPVTYRLSQGTRDGGWFTARVPHALVETAKVARYANADDPALVDFYESTDEEPHLLVFAGTRAPHRIEGDIT